MTLEEQLHAGSRAKEVLENEQFQAAFDAIEKDVIEQWTNSPARDAAGRESLWTYLMLLRKVKAHLEVTLASGKKAEVDLIHKRTAAERLRDGWNSLTE